VSSLHVAAQHAITPSSLQQVVRAWLVADIDLTVIVRAVVAEIERTGRPAAIEATELRIRSQVL